MFQRSFQTKLIRLANPKTLIPQKHRCETLIISIIRIIRFFVNHKKNHFKTERKLNIKRNCIIQLLNSSE